MVESFRIMRTALGGASAAVAEIHHNLCPELSFYFND
jgi:hypothetical protein